MEFVLLFHVIWMMFGMTMEAGMYSLQNVMLERGLDLTVREVRLGIIADPTHEKLVSETCKYALILNNCDTSLRLEMIKAKPVGFAKPSKSAPCIDRAEINPPKVVIVNGVNNELMILRACVLIKPLLPLAGLGQELTRGTNGEYRLLATSAYVMEPFLWQ